MSTAGPDDTTPLRVSNKLGSKERADLVRKTRKLQEVLGVPMHVVDAMADAAQPGHPSTDDFVPRPRLRSLKRRKTEPAGGGILISTSTAVHVDSVRSSSARSRAISPMSPSTVPRSPAPFTSRMNPISTSSPTKARAAGHHAFPASPTRQVRPKRSLASAAEGEKAFAQVPVLQLAPASRTRTPSIVSTATFTSIESGTVPVAQSASPMLNANRRFSCPPSPASSSFDSSTEPSASALRQRHINMANKLHRHLGELIPPELLLGPQPTSPATSPTDTVSLEPPPPKPTHKQSLSLWAGLTKKNANRSKLDLPKGRPSSSSLALSTTSSQNRINGHHRKVMSDDCSTIDSSRSSDSLLERKPLPSQAEWTNKLKKQHGDGQEDGGQRKALPVKVTEVKGSSVIMSAQEKTLNVRRAAKMAQKFGEAPPHALFQITNVATNMRIDVSEANALHVSARGPARPRTPISRTGRAASLSFQSQSYENDIPGQAPARTGRARGSSLSSINEQSSLRSGRSSRTSGETKAALTRSPEDESIVKGQGPVRIALPSPTSPASDSSSSDATLTPKAETTKLPPMNIASIFSSPPSPTPIVAVVPNTAQPTLPPVETDQEEPCNFNPRHPSFSLRRRQATKLTRLFGVEYPELYQAMVIDNPTRVLDNSSVSSRQPRTPLWNDAALRKKMMDDAPPMPFAIVESRPSYSVDLAREGPKDGAWLRAGTTDSCRWSQRGPEEVKMVMDKLRELKA